MGSELVEDVLQKYPEVVPQRTQAPASEYRLNKKLFALYGSLPDLLKNYRVASMEHEHITILTVPATDFTWGKENPMRAITAVYELNESGTTFVPSGRVFIRLQRDEQVKHIVHQLEELGFTIIEIPKYAPYSAWIKHQSGLTHKALANFKAIQKIKFVENVEPQMLAMRSLR